jgi:hypothetical protein
VIVTTVRKAWLLAKRLAIVISSMDDGFFDVLGSVHIGNFHFGFLALGRIYLQALRVL